VDALGRLAAVDACLAREADLVDRKQRPAGDLVAHPNQPRVKIGVRGERGDREHRGLLHAQQGGDGLVEKAWVHVGGFLYAVDLKKNNKIH